MDRARATIAVMLCCSLLCASLSGCAGATRKDQELAKGTAVGAGVGTVLGAGAGYLIGGDNGAVIGGLIGLLAGSAIGYAYASHVYEKIEKASNKADALDKALAQSSKDVDDEYKAIQELEADNKTLDAQTASLSQQYSEHKVSAQALQKQKIAIDKTVEASRKKLEINKQELAYLQQTATPVVEKYGNDEQKQKLQQQIDRLQNQNTDMEARIQTRASLSDRLITG